MARRFTIIPLALVMIHSACVFCIALVDPSQTTPTGFQPALQLWIVLAALDLPVTLVGLAFLHLGSGMSLVGLACFYFLLGGLQWWLIGTAVSWVIRRSSGSPAQ